MAEQESQPKLVPESDLLAVKARLKQETEHLKTQLDEASQKADTHYSSLLAEKAAKEKVAAELEELKKEVEQLRPLTAEKEKAVERIKELENLLLDVKMKGLMHVYKIPAEKLSGKTLAELNAIEEALKLVGREAGRFDVTGAGAGAEAKLSAMEKLKAGFDQTKR